jgi:hypothetical protein
VPTLAERLKRLHEAVYAADSVYRSASPADIYKNSTNRRDDAAMQEVLDRADRLLREALAALTPEPVRPTPQLVQEIIDSAIDEPTDEIRDAIRDADLEAMRLLAEARAEVTRLTAELARMDELANDRGNEVIRLKQAVNLALTITAEDRR